MPTFRKVLIGIFGTIFILGAGFLTFLMFMAGAFGGFNDVSYIFWFVLMVVFYVVVVVDTLLFFRKPSIQTEMRLYVWYFPVTGIIALALEAVF